MNPRESLSSPVESMNARPRRFSDTYIPVTLGATSTTLVGIMFFLQSQFTTYQVAAEQRMTKLETKIELLITEVQRLQNLR